MHTTVKDECNLVQWEYLRKSKELVSQKSLFKTDEVQKLVLDSDGNQFEGTEWLKTHGLVAKKLTIMDVLAPTIIEQQPKYVGILNKKVYAKVFDDVMPFTYHSPEDKDTVRFVNPSAVDLVSYEEKLNDIIRFYDSKVVEILWPFLPQSARNKLSMDENPSSFIDNKEEYLKVLKNLSVPTLRRSIKAINNEITQAQTYLIQSCQLRKESRKSKSKSKAVEDNQKKESTTPSESSSITSDKRPFSAKRWLKKYGLVAKKLTIMDVLAPTIIEQKPKYVGILNKKVYAKVFDDVMPFSYHTPEDKETVRFVNPSAVDLVAYEEKLNQAIESYDKKAAKLIWDCLTTEEKDEITDGVEIPKYTENKIKYDSFLKSSNIGISPKTIKLLENEIDLAETYLVQSRQLRDQTAPKPDSSTKNSKEKKKKKPKIQLNGYRVVAMNPVDGFYYNGTIIGLGENSGEHLIEFDDFDQQSIPQRNFIIVDGSTARPRIIDGDYVLVQLLLPQRNDSRNKIFAPGLIIKSPYSNTDIMFIVLLFTGERLMASRHDLIKITKHRYTNTAQIIFSQLQRSRDAGRCRLVADDYNDDMVSATSTLDEILKNNMLLNKTSTINGSEFGDAEKSIVKSETRSKADENRNDKHTSPIPEARYVDASVETQNIIKVTLECGLQIGGENADTQTHISNEFWDELDKVKYKDFEKKVFPSEILLDSQYLPVLPQVDVPVLKVTKENDDGFDDESVASQSVEVEGKEEDNANEMHSVKVVNSDKGDDDISLSSSSSSSLDSTDTELQQQSEEKDVSSLVPGDMVLARWSDEGWYFRGQIKSKTKTGYIVKDNNGDEEDIALANILVDKVDSSKLLIGDDFVIALHPHYSFSYAPGQIISTEDNWLYQVRLFDETECSVHREELYRISAEQYQNDSEYIKKIQDELLGSFIVTRDNEDGLFKQGMITQISGQICDVLMKGDTHQRDLNAIFNDRKKNRQIVEGSYCLCPLDEYSNIYGPGKVTRVRESSDLIRVTLYDSSELYAVKRDDVFVINKPFYDESIEYIEGLSFDM